MTTISKVIIVTIIGLLLSSCKMDINFSGIKGNGNVITKERSITEDFNTIKVSRGLNVYITQGNSQKLTVEADENLHDIIITEIAGNTLTVTTDKSIGKAAAKKVYITLKNIEYIKSSSGSNVMSTNVISTHELKLESSSGSDIELEVDVETLDCQSSSGGNVVLKGRTDNFYAEASSGSDIKAKNLKTVSAQAKASSGANIALNATEKLSAKASSGADIKYYGNPKIIEINNSVSGSIRKR